MASDRGDKEAKSFSVERRINPHWLLAAAGAGLCAAGLVLLFLNHSAGGATAALVLGGGLVLASVFEPRMVGPQKFGPGGVEFNLMEAAIPQLIASEVAAQLGKLIEVEPTAAPAALPESPRPELPASGGGLHRPNPRPPGASAGVKADPLVNTPAPVFMQAGVQDHVEALPRSQAGIGSSRRCRSP